MCCVCARVCVLNKSILFVDFRGTRNTREVLCPVVILYSIERLILLSFSFMIYAQCCNVRTIVALWLCADFLYFIPPINVFFLYSFLLPRLLLLYFFIFPHFSSRQLGQQAAGDTSILRRALRVASEKDMQDYARKAQGEAQAANVVQSFVNQRGMPMEIVDAEWQMDNMKLTVFFTSDQQRVDFRDFVKQLGAHFKAYVWMVHVNSRVATGKGFGKGDEGKGTVAGTGKGFGKGDEGKGTVAGTGKGFGKGKNAGTGKGFGEGDEGKGTIAGSGKGFGKGDAGKAVAGSGKGFW